MDGKVIGLPDFLKLTGFHAPWEFDGIFVDEERDRVELRLSCPRGTRHRCRECEAADQPTHDFRDLVWEHHRFLNWRCFVRARVPRIRCGHCGKIRSADVPWARPNSGFTLSFEALLLEMCKQAPVKSVSDRMGFGDDRLWRVIDHYVPKGFSLDDLSRARRKGSKRSRSGKVAST